MSRINVGDGGTDGRADFRVVAVDGQRVCIKYDTDGVEHWIADNRFVRHDDGLVVV
jgi:hypothetical protein